MENNSNGDGRRGRKRIRMEKMENESNLQVTFSKRKKGVFRKAFELSVLTGAQVGLILYSPGGKVHSFGHPAVETITDRFTAGISQPLTEEQLRNQTPLNATVAHNIAKINSARNQIEFAYNRWETLDRMLIERQIPPLTVTNIQEQSLSELQELLGTIQNLSGRVEREINNRAPLGQKNLSLGSFGGGGSSRPFVAGPSSSIGGGSDGSEFARPSTFVGGGGGHGGSLQLNVGPASIGGSGRTFLPTPNAFIDGSGSSSGNGNGGFPFHASNGGWQSIKRIMSIVRGGGPHIGGPSSFIGGGSGCAQLNIGPSSIGSSSGGWQSELQPGFIGGDWPRMVGPSSLVGGSGDTGDGWNYYSQQTSAVGGGSHILGPNTPIGGPPFNVGPSSGGSGGVWQNDVRLSSFGGGGQYMFRPNPVIGGGNNGLPVTVGQSSTGGGRGGWQRRSGGLPTTDGANTSQVRNSDNGANVGLLEWHGPTPPN